MPDGVCAQILCLGGLILCSLKPVSCLQSRYTNATTPAIGRSSSIPSRPTSRLDSSRSSTFNNTAPLPSYGAASTLTTTLAPSSVTSPAGHCAGATVHVRKAVLVTWYPFNFWDVIPVKTFVGNDSQKSVTVGEKADPLVLATPLTFPFPLEGDGTSSRTAVPSLPATVTNIFSVHPDVPPGTYRVDQLTWAATYNDCYTVPLTPAVTPAPVIPAQTAAVAFDVLEIERPTPTVDVAGVPVCMTETRTSLMSSAVTIPYTSYLTEDVATVQGPLPTDALPVMLGNSSLTAGSWTAIPTLVVNIEEAWNGPWMIAGPQMAAPAGAFDLPSETEPSPPTSSPGGGAGQVDRPVTTTIDPPNTDSYPTPIASSAYPGKSFVLLPSPTSAPSGPEQNQRTETATRNAINGPSPTVQMPVTVPGAVLYPTSTSVVLVGGEYLVPGGPAITAGSHTFSMPASGSSVVVDSLLRPLPKSSSSPSQATLSFMLDGIIITVQQIPAYAVGNTGQVLAPNGDIVVLESETTLSLSGTALALIAAGSTSYIGLSASTALGNAGTKSGDIAASMQRLALTIDGQIYTASILPDGETGFVIAGQTLLPGHAITATLPARVSATATAVGTNEANAEDEVITILLGAAGHLATVIGNAPDSTKNVTTTAVQTLQNVSGAHTTATVGSGASRAIGCSVSYSLLIGCIVLFAVITSCL